MKKLLFFLGSGIIQFFSIILTLQGADVRHTYGDNPLNSFYVDDQGGSINNGGSNLSYFINFQDVDQSSRGTLLLYGSSTTLGSQVDNAYVDEDFDSSSGIDIYPLSNLLGASFDGEMGLAASAPLTPVSFEGENTALRVEQVTYTSHATGDNFVILEYRVLNLGSESVHTILGLANDFDIDLKDIDASAAFLNSGGIPKVYQQELPPNSSAFTTVGVALIAGTLAQHRIESCSGAFPYCSIFATDNDATRLAFFEGSSTQVGDLTNAASNLDFAVTLAADLGNIASNRGASAVFCYTVANGSNATEALTALESTTSDCQDFYQNNLQVCQNNLVNFGEECDDGNTSNLDDCTNFCLLPVCGDGFAQAGNGEQCDNGNLNSNSTPNACRTDCQAAHCGDSVTDNGEQCDDGNNVNTDACIHSCQNARCGDSFVQRGRGEFCDDGNNINGDGCSADCLSFESCGNGSVDPGEVCDDGNNITSDACPSGNNGTCQTATCGDGFLQQNVEECDDGNNTSGDGCDASCTSEVTSSNPAAPPAVCGNGIVETGEECDDGNDIESDACASDCHPLALQGGSSTLLNDSGTGSGGCAISSSALPDSASFWMMHILVLLWLGLKQREKLCLK